ncbi:hypothetical protein D9611_000195 [Ephemerocybe angulata]|uniref:Endonuclease/exonuclease/phosphatase domain-containing protein n=1 Tax=Ephemerocybe angulata TaxID=980116 RepID=A0A8H5BPG1_9AGAR|nr:hypothetical protein D9611_000195 [Tulosesus angulatus]
MIRHENQRQRQQAGQQGTDWETEYQRQEIRNGGTTWGGRAPGGATTEAQPEARGTTNSNTTNIAHYKRKQVGELALLNDELANDWDIVLLQEPNMNYYDNILTPRGFRPVCPGADARAKGTVRSGIWMSESISTNSWEPLEMGDALDITGSSVYYNCTHNRTEETLRKYIDDNKQEIYGNGGHVIWAGDFNRHHPMWDDDRDDRLFTRKALDDVEELIGFAAEWGIEQVLEKGTPILEHTVRRRSGRGQIICDTRHDLRPPMTDHVPVATILNMKRIEAPETERRNFRMTDWEEFATTLEIEITGIDPKAPITSKEVFDARLEAITAAIQRTVEKVVPMSKPTSYTRRWWNKSLEKMRKRKQKLSRAHTKY